MKQGDTILLPTENILTVIGVQHEKEKGKHIPLSKYKIMGIYWEEVYYPYPHSVKRIELKKGASKTYIKYAETVENILSALN